MSNSQKEIDEHQLWLTKQKVLESSRQLLCSNLEPRQHYPFLRSRLVFSRSDEELIENTCHTTRERVSKFIDIIITKGPKAFDDICDSIESNRTQMFLLQHLNKELERELNRQRDQYQPFIQPMMNVAAVTSYNFPNPGEPDGPDIPSDPVKLLDGEGDVSSTSSV